LAILLLNGHACTDWQQVGDLAEKITVTCPSRQSALEPFGAACSGSVFWLCGDFLVCPRIYLGSPSISVSDRNRRGPIFGTGARWCIFLSQGRFLRQFDLKNRPRFIWKAVGTQAGRPTGGILCTFVLGCPLCPSRLFVSLNTKRGPSFPSHFYFPVAGENVL
jgi:hypothetical protein